MTHNDIQVDPIPKYTHSYNDFEIVPKTQNDNDVISVRKLYLLMKRH